MNFFALGILSLSLFCFSTLGTNALGSDSSFGPLKKFCGANATELNSCRNLKYVMVAQFTPAQDGKILKLIDDSTDSWGDSIFEGEVDSNMEDFRIDSKQQIFSRESKQDIGYKIEFSYAGWALDSALGQSCVDNHYDRAKPETFATCAKGRISQTIYVTPDFAEYDVISEANLVLNK